LFRRRFRQGSGWSWRDGGTISFLRRQSGEENHLLRFIKRGYMPHTAVAAEDTVTRHRTFMPFWVSLLIPVPMKLNEPIVKWQKSIIQVR